MATTVCDVVQLLEIIAPPWYASEGDPIGLAAGRQDARVTRLLLALDATLPVIAEARKTKCQMLLTHHPRIYRPLKSLAEETYAGRVAAELSRARLALYSAHTNLDIAPGGVNDRLADCVGLTACAPLQITGRDRHLKLVVFVPESHIELVREAICAAGAGCIGEYADCTFRTLGTGTFCGSATTRPFIGKAGTIEEATEARLETILPTSLKHTVIQAMLAAHPYEEVAYDLIPLETGTPFGLGRVGDLLRPTRVETLARRLRKVSGGRGVQCFGSDQRPRRRIAVWSGSGCPVERALMAGAEVIVTGEMSYHDLELLDEAGAGAILLGHGPCEALALLPLAESLRAGLPGVEVLLSNTPTLDLMNLR